MTLRTHLDGTIFAEHRSGQGPLLLALHGWGRDRNDLLPALGDRHVISVDLPGFGSSPPPPAAWETSQYADAMARLIEESASEPVIVVGHSFGGRVAAHLAAEHGSLVRGVAFAGVPLVRRSTKGHPPISYRAVRTARRLRLVPDSVLERSRSRHGSADYRAAEGTMRDVLVKAVNEDYTLQLEQIRCPVAFIWGERDTAAPPSVAEAASQLVADVVFFSVYPGAAHDVHRTVPEAFDAAIDALDAAS